MRLVGLIAIGMFLGCGPAGKPATPVDDNHIRSLVGHVAEYHANAKAFGALFVEGAAPNDATRTKLRGMMTKVEQARVDDTGASATVDVIYEVLQTGELKGPVQWKLVKAGDKWRVGTFALPEALAAGQ